MKIFDMVTMIILIVGGLNWGLLGALNFDLVAMIFGEMSMLSRLVYIVVSLCAIYHLVMIVTKRSCLCK